MPRLEELQTGTVLRDLADDGLATVKSRQWHDDQGGKVIYETAGGNLDKCLLYRDDEPGLVKLAARRPEHEPEQTSFL